MALNDEKEFAISGKQKGSVRQETNAVSGTKVMNVQNRHQEPLHPLNHQHQEVEVRREKRSFRGRSPSGKFARRPCKDHLKGTCTKSSCDDCHPPECQFKSQNRDVNSAQSARLRTGRLRNNQIKGRRRVVTKVQQLL